MKIVIPENMGSDLRLIPDDSYNAVFADLFVGLSAAKKPKLTVKYVLTSEYTGKKDPKFKTCIGEAVLETFSLQPQAMFKINGLYKQVKGEDLPANREFNSEEDFAVFMKEVLAGAQFVLLLETVTNDGKERTDVRDRKLLPKKSFRK